MAHTLLISDLHLCTHQPQLTQAFDRLVQDHALHAEALYILGDLFEYWAGDDALADPLHGHVAQSLHSLSQRGIRVYLMHGNRDLLMGEVLARACGARLVSDPTLIDLYGQPTLLTHGDALCTDDADYQAFRVQVRDPRWQAQFLAQPLVQRKAFIEKVRVQSEAGKHQKSLEIMDVNADAVVALLRAHGYPRLIHGHTHRPGRHVLHLDDHTCERWVLSDWGVHGHALQCDAGGCQPLKF